MHTGPIRLDASLYLAGDSVTNAALFSYSDPNVPRPAGSNGIITGIIGYSGDTLGLIGQGTIGVQITSLLASRISLPALQALSGDALGLIGTGTIRPLIGNAFLASPPPQGNFGGNGIIAPAFQQFGLIGNPIGLTAFGLAPTPHAWSGNVAGLISDGIGPTFRGLSGQIILFDFWLEGQLEGFDFQGFLGEPLDIFFRIDGELPPLVLETNVGWVLDSGIDASTALPFAEREGVFGFEGSINNERFTLDGELDGIEVDALVINADDNFAIVSPLPGLGFEWIAAWNLDAALTETLISETEFTQQSQFILDGRLEGLAGELSLFTFAGTPCAPDWDLDGCLSTDLATLEFFVLDSGLGDDEAALCFDGLLGTKVHNAGRTYVINTETDELTEYADYSFDVIRQLQSKRYGVMDGVLYRLNDRNSTLVSAPAYFRTHADNRIFNDRGELIPTQKLLRNYGAYVEVRVAPEDGFIIETFIDEESGDIYDVIEGHLRSNGYDVVRVDFYRGVTGHKWAIGMANKNNSQISIMGVTQLLQELEKKIHAFS